MRDIALLLGCLAMVIPLLRYPHIGVLLWCWAAMIIPGSFVYGFMFAVPLNKIVAIVTLIVWLLSREPKKVPMTSTMWLLALFGVWGTISALTGISDLAKTMIEWQSFLKTIVFVFVVVGLITTKARLDALLYAIYLSLGFHGIAEGVKFIVSGGRHHVYGPLYSIIYDNNHFALAMVAVIPIVFYLYKQAENKLVRVALLGTSFLVIASIMGTASRGGLIGVLAVGGFAMMRSKKKVKYVMALVPIAVAAVVFAPDRWSERMDTIASATDDSSFMGRVIAWKQSTLIALDHPFFGGGFHAQSDIAIWLKYANVFNRLDFVPTPPPDLTWPHVAHSIYFQTLGDMGFVGLAIFICILVSTWRNGSAVIRSANNRPEWTWASDLAKSLQYTLVAYFVSGAALNLAYFEFIYMVFGVLVALRKMVGEPKKVTGLSRAALVQ